MSDALSQNVLELTNPYTRVPCMVHSVEHSSVHIVNSFSCSVIYQYLCVRKHSRNGYSVTRMTSVANVCTAGRTNCHTNLRTKA